MSNPRHGHWPCSLKLPRCPAPRSRAPRVRRRPRFAAVLRRIPWWPVAITLVVIVTRRVRRRPDPRRRHTRRRRRSATRSCRRRTSRSRRSRTCSTRSRCSRVGATHRGRFCERSACSSCGGCWRPAAKRPTIAARSIAAALAPRRDRRDVRRRRVPAAADGGTRPSIRRNACSRSISIAHRRYSHDGRQGWTRRRRARLASRRGLRRRLHHGSSRRSTARSAASRRTRRVAGQGTMILQGLEAVYRGEHVNILERRPALQRTHRPPNLSDIDEQALADGEHDPADDAGDDRDDSRAICDKVPAPVGSPARAAASGDRDRRRFAARTLADASRSRAHRHARRQAQPRARSPASDNHGWGRTAPGWTLLRIPGWRGMTGDSLSRRIEEVLRNGRTRSDASRRASRG